MTKAPETIRYTADVVVTTDDNRVLLIQRAHAPHAGQWALPGGHVDTGETSRDAAARELAEETGIYATPGELTQIGVWDAPDRDPRGRYVTAAYAVTVHSRTQAEPATDAADARWFHLTNLPELAFDHAEIIRAAAPLAS
ncbi:NUDIX domain-containing protein [Streptomyces sp. NPDC001274]